MEFPATPFFAFFGLLTFAPIVMLFVDGWRSGNKNNSWKNVGAFLLLAVSAKILLKLFGMWFVCFVPIAILAMAISAKYLRTKQ